MGRRLVADVSPSETRIAQLDGNALVEINIETSGKERLVGNIYKGRTMNTLPGMQAAFIDVGLDRNAFLYAGDILTEEDGIEETDPKHTGPYKRPEVPNIREVLQPGEQIIVQVLKQPGGTKGARVTTRVTLPGRLLVLTPTVDHIGISRRITDEEERSRLHEIVERLRPARMGVILRTAAENAKEEEIIKELEFYSKLWERIQRKASLVSAPRLIHAEQKLLFRTVRDDLMEDIEEFIINDEEAYDRARALAAILAPNVQDRIKLYSGQVPVFDAYGIEDKIEQALQRKVWLKNGAYLVIDEAEALTAIDVNTGKFTGSTNLQDTILKTNLEAADEIARQLRLRDLSGIIVVDFIDMEVPKNKKLVVERLEKAVAADRTKTNVLGMTNLGLVELTRKRMRRDLSALTQTVCPTCGGTGRVLNLDAVIRKVRLLAVRLIQREESGLFLVNVSKNAAQEILLRNNHEQLILPEHPRMQFYVKGAETLSPEHVRISAVTNRDMLDGAQLFR